MKPLRGDVRVPGDKSIGHRALLFGALAEGIVEVVGLSSGEDVRSTARCLTALGASIAQDKGRTRIVGGPLKPADGPLDCGNSGTTTRLLSGILAGQPFETSLFGDASLQSRPMGRVAEPLRAMGAKIELTDNKLPMKIRGARPLKAISYQLPVPSAQVKSAILLAGLFADGETHVEDPFETRDHTERMLKAFGGGFHKKGSALYVRPSPLKSPGLIEVPGDISSAAFFALAAAIVPGSDIAIRDVGINPTRTGFLDALKEMGALVTFEDQHEVCGEPVGTVRVRHAPLRGIHLRPKRIPALVDEVPALAVAAALATGETRLEGLGELRHKESDRLAATAENLRAIGSAVEVEGDTLIVRGPAKLKGAPIDTKKDHRLAMAFSVAGLVSEGEMQLSDRDCVAISYPSFFSDLKSLVGASR